MNVFAWRQVIRGTHASSKLQTSDLMEMMAPCSGVSMRLPAIGLL